MISFIYGLFSAASRLYAQEQIYFTNCSKARVLATYYKLKLLGLTRNVQNIKQVQVFGRVVAISSFESFVYVFEEIFIERPYQFISASPSPTIIDAGANIGLATIFFKMQFPLSKIICFEPDPDAFALLKKNVSGLSDVFIVQKALASSEGEACFYKDSRIASVGAGITSVRDQKNFVTVSTTRLSTYLGDSIDFLKLDIEGGELEVILDISPQLAKIKLMVIECHHRPEIKSHFAQILSLLSSKGSTYRLSAQPSRYAFNSVDGQDILVHSSQSI